MKKSVLFCFLLACCLLAGGCGAKKEEGEVLCTTYAAYDWARILLKDVEGASVRMLAKNGTDMHSYQASAADMIAIREAKLLIYVGGESEEWVKDAIKAEDKRTCVDVSLLELLGEDVLEVGGHEHEHEEGEEHHHDEELFDEHVWLSVQNAGRFVTVLADRLAALYPEAKETIGNNCEQYQAELAKLDAAFAELAKKADPMIVVADRFPFAYLFHDYEIAYEAAFEGCSAESEASFDTILQLAKVCDAHQVNVIYVLDASDGRLANTVKDNTSSKQQEIAVLQSMQSVGGQETKSYIEYMQENLEALAKSY